MKTKQLLFLFSIILLLSCSNVKTNSSNLTKVSDISRGNSGERLLNERNRESADSLNYYYSNDSLFQVICIRRLNMSKEYEIPEKIEFRLVLRDKLSTYSERKFNGIAVLTSPNESFMDKSKIDEGLYFAADYSFSTKDYDIKIRLDIENYEACVIYIESDHIEKVLMGFEKYIKSYPNYDIMRKTD